MPKEGFVYILGKLALADQLVQLIVCKSLNKVPGLKRVNVDKECLLRG